MSFFKKLFGGKKDASENSKIELNVVDNSLGGSPNERKKMTLSDLMRECVMVVKENLENDRYVATEIREDSVIMPQLIVEKGQAKCAVFVLVSNKPEEIKDVLTNDQIKEYMKIASELQADCLIGIVCAKSPDGGELYYGEANSYSIKFKLFPNLF